MYRQHVQYLLNFAFEDVFPEKKMGENFNSNHLSLTSPGPHSSLSSPWNFDLLFELNSSPIEPEGIQIIAKLLLHHSFHLLLEAVFLGWQILAFL